MRPSICLIITFYPPPYIGMEVKDGKTEEVSGAALAGLPHSLFNSSSNVGNQKWIDKIMKSTGI